MKKEINIVGYSNMNFQRNGVSGDSFYSIILETKEKDTNNHFLITFETDEADLKINRHTCRVVELNNLSESWRGDIFADHLNEMFQELRNGFHLGLVTIYDFLEMERNYKKAV